MKLLALFLSALLTSPAWSGTAKKYSPPSSLDYSVEVKPTDSFPPAGEESTSTILEKEMGTTEKPLAVDSQPAPSAETVTAPESESKVEAADKNLREDQIPVLKEREKPAEAVSNGLFYKVIVAATLIILMIGGLAFSTRKYFQKNGVANKHTNIRVITQHSLGGRKNLAIITVAGEYILLGVTDHNINLIKTLSLMDDEIPEQTPSKFNAALKNAEARPDFVELTGVKPSVADGEDSFSIRSIKEVVSQKLRGMKEFS